MSIETELVAFLIADSAVAALIERRMFPVFAPHDADAPYIVYRRMTTPRLSTMGGPGTAHPTFRLTCWAMTYAGAIDLGNAVRGALDGQKGPLWGDIQVQSVSLENESDAFTPSVELEEEQMLGRQLDFEIWHSE